MLFTIFIGLAFLIAGRVAAVPIEPQSAVPNIISNESPDDFSIMHPIKCNNYLAKCSSFEVFMQDGLPVLGATCRTTSGETAYPSIGLNECLGNDDGRLRVGKYFAGTCRNIAKGNYMVCAECREIGGRWVVSCINTNTFICYHYNNLRCAKLGYN